MSNKLLTWAWEVPLRSAQKVILVALADYANDQGQCWPSINQLVKRCGLCRASVITNLSDLMLKGLLWKEIRCSGDNHHQSNVYTLIFGHSSQSGYTHYPSMEKASTQKMSEPISGTGVQDSNKKHLICTENDPITVQEIDQSSPSDDIVNELCIFCIFKRKNTCLTSLCNTSLPSCFFC